MKNTFDKVKEYDKWESHQKILKMELENKLKDLTTEFQLKGLENQVTVNTIHDFAEDLYNDYYHYRDWLSVN